MFVILKTVWLGLSWLRFNQVSVKWHNMEEREKNWKEDFARIYM